jgi:hypothetical protein
VTEASPSHLGRWIVSPKIDLAMLGLPLLFTLLALLGALVAPRVEDLPLWAFLFLVVAFDVAHVWATVFISYLDTAALKRRRLLFLLPIPLTVVIGYRLHLHSPALFWTLMAYVAIHHFMAQQWGFVALYKLRAGERFDRYLDKWTVYVGALGPVLYWHTTDAAFDWFGHGERFLTRLPADLQSDILWGMGIVAAVYVARQVAHAHSSRFNLGKNLWMAAVWASWSLGIGMASHPLVSLACINLLHGIPFLVLVWWRLKRGWSQASSEERSESRFLAWLSGAGAEGRNRWLLILVFYVPLLVVGLAEEGAWEGLVWGNYLPRVEGLSAAQLSLIVAVLSTPQIVHYYLDAWLWKLDGSNPDFERALGLPERSTS